MLPGYPPAIIWSAPRVPRDKPPTSERRGSITKLGVGRGLLSFSETNSCQCVHPMGQPPLSPDIIFPKRDSGYTPCSASPPVLLS